MLGIYIQFSVGWSFDHIFCCLLCTLVWHKQRNTRHTHTLTYGWSQLYCTTQTLTHTHTLKNQTHICSDIHKVTQTGDTHIHTDTQICKLAVILISTEFEWLEIDRTLIPYLRKLRTVTEECRHGQLTILDQSLPRPSRLYSPAMVKIHGSHGECRKERDLYMNRECWCKFINMHQHCWGCYGQYNMTLCPDAIYSMLWEIDFQRSFFGLFMFLHPSMIWGNPAVRSNQTLLLPGSNRTANGGHWQRRGMKGGPISLLTTDFIPRVKGLISVTFTWFKSPTQLNQKSMKSLGYIFGLSCQHFKLNAIFSTPAEQRKKKEEKWAKHRRGWNLTTHWKISPIAVMGLCRNGKYTRKIQKILKLKNDNPYLPRHCWLIISWEIWTNTASTHVVHCDINIHQHLCVWHQAA